MTRTSQTHPLFVNALPVAAGRIGLTLCPGKQGDSIFGAPWARDLETDIRAIRDWGARHVVTLLELSEMATLGVEALGEEVQKHGLAWHPLPIPDQFAPDDRSAWEALSPLLHQALDAGEDVLVHCRGGLGRAGTVAALLLIERGDSADDAIARVRAARRGAIETEAQEAFLQARATVPDHRTQAIRAALFGCAVGDALGVDVEFRSLADIRRKYPHGIDALPPHDGRAGAISDDTQMMLFTAEALCRAIIRQTDRGICHTSSVIGHGLMRWLVTQGDQPARSVCDVGLVADKRLHRRRAPGMTCLSALRAMQDFSDPARNDSKGCGTIMRVAPVAFAGHPDEITALARESSALTHGHPTGQDAAVAWALILHSLLQGIDLETAARDAAMAQGDETRAAIARALEAPRDGRAETVETLGGGWTAEEALSIALYACLCAPDPETGWRIAVTHSGDSDSTGAIAGAALGLLYPKAVMSHPWRCEIEAADLIDRVACDLAYLTDPGMRLDGEAGDLPGHTDMRGQERVVPHWERDTSDVARSQELRARYPGW